MLQTSGLIAVMTLAIHSLRFTRRGDKTLTGTLKLLKFNPFVQIGKLRVEQVHILPHLGFSEVVLINKEIF